jgi:hypothetical protein
MGVYERTVKLIGRVNIMDNNQDAKPLPVDITHQLRQHQAQSSPKLEVAAPQESEVSGMHKLIKDFYLPFFDGTRHKLFITNENKVKAGSMIYGVTITPTGIVFELSSDVKKNRIVYDFEKETIALNNDLKDATYLKSFIEKLERMSADIRSQRAEVFEELVKKDKA